MSPPAPTVSVVIPTYNRGALIQPTIDSVLAQTYPALEILVVDDGSTDGTAEWVEQHYGEKVKVLRQKNGGVARARNHGWRVAQGEWIAFLDHDDIFFPEKLEVALREAKPEVGVIVPKWREVEAGEVLRTRPENTPGHQRDFDWLYGWHNPIASMSVPLVRKSTLQQVGGFDPFCVPADDWDLWLRLAKVCQFAFCPIVTTDYLLHPNQQRRDEKRMFRAVRHVLSKHPLALSKRPLLLWWLLWSGAFVASKDAYEDAKSGAPLLAVTLDATKAHPLALLSPQWVALIVRRIPLLARQHFRR